jgi:tRNA pseudouridine55 synthase
MKSRNKSLFPPLIFNVFKPARMTSYDVVRHFKRHLPHGFGKIGHFGTLDPFASGILMIGISGAARLNDFIHDSMPKTYLAIGKLGIETPTGDYTSEITQRDESFYLKHEIAQLPKDFIENRLREKFMGEYMQPPHKYSAAKFMGKNLHEWAREGVEIKKGPVLRHVYHVEVVKYAFPYLSLRLTVSSGTYIRTLYSDMCNDLGTIGSLISLVREQIGAVSFKDSLHLRHWPLNREANFIEKGLNVTGVLPFPSFALNEQQVLSFKNGAFLKFSELQGASDAKYYWMLDCEKKVLGLAQKIDERFAKPKINFHQEGSLDS